MTASTFAQDLSSLEGDKRLFLYTSLTAGSSHIITATSRMETILKANKIPFLAIDIATAEKERRLWQRRAGKRKLPGLVKEGFVLGDLDEIEEWNEFEELKENLGHCPPIGQATNLTRPPPPSLPLPVKTTATQGTATIAKPGGVAKPTPGLDESKMRALPGAAEIAARASKSSKSTVIDSPPAVESMTSAPEQKESGIAASRADHLSAPPSALPSGTSTPAVPPVSETTIPVGQATGINELTASATSEDKADHISAPPSGVQTPAQAQDSGIAPALAIRNLKAEEGLDSRVEHLSAPPSGIQTPESAEEMSAPPSGVQTPAKDRETGLTSAAAQVSAVENLKAEEGAGSVKAEQASGGETAIKAADGIAEGAEAMSVPGSGTQTPAKTREEGLGSAAAQVAAVRNLESEGEGVAAKAGDGVGGAETGKGVTLPEEQSAGKEVGGVEGVQTLPGTQTQAQEPAKAAKAGESVED